MSTYFDTYPTLRLTWPLAPFSVEQRHWLLSTGADIAVTSTQVSATYTRADLVQLLAHLRESRKVCSVREKLMAAA